MKCLKGGQIRVDPRDYAGNQLMNLQEEFKKVKGIELQDQSDDHDISINYAESFCDGFRILDRWTTKDGKYHVKIDFNCMNLKGYGKLLFNNNSKTHLMEIWALKDKPTALILL